MQTRWGIPGWFNFASFYDQIADELPNPCHVVEVGTMFGCSARYLAARLSARGIAFTLDLVDTFDEKNLGLESREIAIKHGGFRKAFDHFSKGTALESPHVNVLQMTSLSAAWRYEAESLDFVFLDGAHDMNTVHMEIEAFKPRMKVGSVLAGHDIDQEGVMRAVSKVFGTAWQQRPGGVWVKRILTP